MTEEDKADLFNQIRIIRNNLLKDSDWTQLIDAPVDRTAWAVYRQQLRDLPNNLVADENGEYNFSFPNQPENS